MWLLIFSILLILFSTGILYRNSFILYEINNRIKNNEQIAAKFDNDINEVAKQNQLYVQTFRNLEKNEYFRIGLILLNLKKYHEQILIDLDPKYDVDFYKEIMLNINEIENSLKQISILTPNIVDKVNSDFSIFDELLIDKTSKFYKN